MEDKRDTLSLKNYLQTLNIPQNENTDTIVRQIALLLDNQEPKMSEEIYKKREIPLLKEMPYVKNIYSIYSVNFSLDIDDSVKELVVQNFKHLSSLESSTKQSYIFKVTLHNNLYTIFINDKEVQRDIHSSQLLGFLQDFIRITIYENSNLFVAFHSAMLSYKKVPLIFPALSGSGKSTLSAFLMQKEGFKFYSDEVTPIDKEYAIKPLPLSIVLKEGSWSILKELDKEIKDAIVYKRFDSQNIKYIAPKNIATQTLNAKEAIMIFPLYKEGVSLVLKPLTLIESMDMLVKSGYHLDEREKFSSVKKYLDYLSGLKIYHLVYSNLEEAYITIKELIDEHS